MIDPLITLAFSVHSNKGVYALLLGSGISTAAGIPTGWEIVLDLIRKLAAVEGADCEPDDSLTGPLLRLSKLSQHWLLVV